MKNPKTNKAFWNWYLNKSQVKNDLNTDLYFDNNMVSFLNQNIEREDSEVIFNVMRYYEEIYSDTQQTEDLINRSNEL